MASLVPFSIWLHPQVAEAAWADDNWSYRKAIPIAGHTTSENNVFVQIGASGGSADTYGQTGDGGSTSSSSADSDLTNRAIESSSRPANFGTVDSIRARLWLSGSGSTTAKGLLYDANGTLLATGDEVLISNTSEQEITLPFSGGQRKHVDPLHTYGYGVMWDDPGSISIQWSRGSTPSTAIKNTAGFVYPNATNPLMEGSTVAGPVDMYVSYTTDSLGSGSALDTSDSTKFQADCGDIRFTTANGDQLPYYVASGCGTSSTLIHVFFDTFPAGSQIIYMYYGNAQASNGFTATPFATHATGYTFGSAGAEERGPSPVAYWKFNDGSGTTAHDSGAHANTVTLRNGAAWASSSNCVTGDCLQLDGTDDYADANDSNSLTLSTALTLQAWIKPTALANNTNFNILAKDDYPAKLGYRLFLHGNPPNQNTNRLVLEVNDGSQWGLTTASGIDITDLTHWTHVAATFDSGSVKLYVNGIERYSTTLPVTTIAPASNKLQIGRYSSGIEYFAGYIDEAKIYGYARTADQIKADYVSRGSPLGSGAVLGAIGESALKDSLVGHWKLDEGMGATAHNSSGQVGLDGAMSFFSAPATTTSGWTSNGKYGQSLAFDGLNDRILVSDTALLEQQQFTIAAWVNVNALASGGYPSNPIVAKYDDAGSQRAYLLGVDNSSQNVFFEVSPSGISSFNTVLDSGFSLALGTWYFVAASFDGASLKIFINGRLVNSMNANNNTIFNGTAPFSIGSRNGAGVPAKFFNGKIDEVAYYDAALSDDQVRTAFNFQSAVDLVASGIDSSGNISNSQNAAYCVPGDTTTSCTPILEWRFNERQGGTVNDTSGHSLSGTTSAGASWTQGKIDSALQFNGSNGYASRADHNLLDVMSVTVSGWIKVSAWSGSYPRLIGKLGAYEIVLMTSGAPPASLNWKLDNGAGDMFANNVITQLNTWYYVAATYSSGTGRIYVNGKLVAENTSLTNGALDNSSQAFAVGSQAGAAWYFNGAVDEVRLYNYAMTPAQIAWDYNRGKPVVHYKLDECQGAVAHDSSGNGFNGSITIGATGTQTAIGDCSSSGSAWANGADGKYNRSLNFDGTDDTISSSSSPTFIKSGGFSTSQWVKRFGTNMGGYISSIYGTGTCAGAQYELRFNGAGTNLSFNIPNAVGNCSAASAQLNTNATNFGNGWHHVVGTFDGTTAKLYVDGALVGSGTFSGTFNTSPAGVFNVGKQGSSGQGNFRGQIDDVQLYNYPLNDYQIKALYNQNAAVRFGPSTGSP